MTSTEEKRTWVAELYPGPKWKRQVKKMPDAQIIAIYMREQNKAKKEPKPEPKESSDDDIPF